MKPKKARRDRDFDDVPPLSAAELKKFRPAAEIVPAIVAAAKRGRPKAESPKVLISFRLDANVVKGLRELGPGWQTEANRVLHSFVAKGADRKIAAYTVVRNAKTGAFLPKRKKPAASPKGPRASQRA